MRDGQPQRLRVALSTTTGRAVRARRALCPRSGNGLDRSASCFGVEGVALPPQGLTVNTRWGTLEP